MAREINADGLLPDIKRQGPSQTERKLEESEAMFRSIVENSHAGIFIVDNRFRFVYGNDKFSEILGYPIGEIVGNDFRFFLSEESKQFVADRYLRRQRGEDVPSRYEIDIIRKNGERRHLELSSSVVRDVVGEMRTVGQVLDITERKHAEEELVKAHSELETRVQRRTAELKRTNELLEQEIVQHRQTQVALEQSSVKYRHLIDNANSIILEMDTKGNVLFMNKFGLDFFGFSEPELLGKSVLGTIVSPRDVSGHDLEAMIHGIVTHPENYRHNENENMLHNGERVWIVWTNQPVFDEEGILSEILCIGIDRTKQKQEEDVKDRAEKEKAAADERSRLARDLHDAVSQTLFSASLIADVLPRLWEKNQSEGRKRLKEVRELTRGALAEMRTLLLELRPSSLADAELSDLLRQLGESITGRARVPVSVTIEGECKLSTDVKIALYRIAQEALNNVAKHSEATEARVTLRCRPDSLALSVIDNGRGFSIKNLAPDSLGLGIMRERASAIGAGISVKSKPGQGTEVTVSLDMTKGGNSHVAG